MANSTTSHFQWYKHPDATIKDDFIERGVNFEGELYYPNENKAQIINAISLIKNENDALEFVKEWGELGSTSNKNFYQRCLVELTSVADYIFFTKRLTEPLPAVYLEKLMNLPDQPDYMKASKEEYEEYRKIQDEVVKNYNRITEPDGYRYVLHYDENSNSYSSKSMQIQVRGESICSILSYAESVRFILDLLFLVKRYEEDYLAAEKEAELWFNSLNPDDFMIKYHLHLISDYYGFLKYKSKSDPDLEVYPNVLGVLIESLRQLFSFTTHKGVWVNIDPKGQPVFEFECLRSFIDYTILTETNLFPTRCSDPTCNNIFFPSRAGQKYCPQMSWEKRSRCEQRHTKVLQRKSKKK